MVSTVKIVRNEPGKIQHTGHINANYVKRCSNQYLLLTAVLCAVMILILLRTFWGEGYFFFSKGIMSDLVRINLPTYYSLYDSIASGGSFWTWHIGIGTSAFAHADVIMDPFTYILFLRGREHIPDMFLWLQVCKTICMAVAAYLYLSWFKLDARVCVLCANLYALSGIQIFSNNFVLGTFCVYCPIYLLGIERGLAKKGWIVAFLSLLGTALYSYYFFYVSGILCGIYMLVRLLMTGGRNFRQFIAPFAVLAGLGIACVGLSCFILLPQVQLATSGVRTTTGKDVAFSATLFVPQLENFCTAVSRTFQLNFLGDAVNQDYKGKFDDYFQFTTYITAAAIPLMAQFWAGAKRRARKCFLAIVLLCFACITIPFFAFAMNSFSTINYRWMFIINLMLALGCALGIQAILLHRGFYHKTLYFSILAAFIVMVSSSLVIAVLKSVDLFASGIAWVSPFVVWGFLIVLDLYIRNRKKRRKHIYAGVIACAVVAVTTLEADINYRPWYSDEPHIWGYQNDERIYDDTDWDIVQNLMNEDVDFYRIQKNFDPVVDKNNIASLSDAMAQGYYGLSAYCSLNNPEYSSFITNMDMLCHFSQDVQSAYESQILQINPLENGNYQILNKSGQALTLREESREVLFEDLQDDALNQQWVIEPASDEEDMVFIISAQSENKIAYIPQEGESGLGFIGESLGEDAQEIFALKLVGLAGLHETQDEESLQQGYYEIYVQDKSGLITGGSNESIAQVVTATAEPSALSGPILNYIHGVYDHYDLMSYLGVKYYLSKGKAENLPDYFSLYKEEDGYYIYRNEAYYPLAFESSNVISEEEFLTLYGPSKEALLLNATVVEDEKTDFDGETGEILALAQTKQDAFRLNEFSEDYFEFTLNVSEDAQYLNLSMPYDKDWHVTIDGEEVPTKRVNLGLLGVRLEDEQKGHTIVVRVKYVPSAVYMGAIISGCSAIVGMLVLAFLKRKKKSKLELQYSMA